MSQQSIDVSEMVSNTLMGVFNTYNNVESVKSNPKEIKRRKNRPVSIYMLTCPLGTATCYVGQSVTPSTRLESHMTKSTSPIMRAWIKSLVSIEQEPIMTILDVVPAEYAREAEQDAIVTVKAQRGARCLNGPSVY